jgi:hypothetical protein
MVTAPSFPVDALVVKIYNSPAEMAQDVARIVQDYLQTTITGFCGCIVGNR